jgi:predicted anti-sigma-YlaC factor YlaD
MRLVGQLSSACELARGQISLDLDGELSELEQAALNAHVVGCGGCRAYRESAAGVTTLLRSAHPEQPEFPVVLSRRSRVRVPLRAVQAAAAAAVLAVIGFSGAGLTGGGEGSVTFTAASNPDRGVNVTPKVVGRAAADFRVLPNTAIRPRRDGIHIV